MFRSSSRIDQTPSVTARKTRFGREGSPLVDLLLYKCPKGDMQKWETYYDPSNPPICPVHNIPMVYIADPPKK